jgi:hypothetical protein
MRLRDNLAAVHLAAAPCHRFEAVYCEEDFEAINISLQV